MYWGVWLMSLLLTNCGYVGNLEWPIEKSAIFIEF